MTTPQSEPGTATDRELQWAQLLAAEPHRIDQMVLSAEAHHHLADIHFGSPGLEGSFEFRAAAVKGRLRIGRGSGEGWARVAIEMYGQEFTDQPPPGAIRFEAEVREHWLQALTSTAATKDEQAATIVRALAEIAAIPGQKTVVVSVDAP